MENYTLVCKIGEGSYARVWQARAKRDGKIVAIKQLKTPVASWDECLHLGEVKLLQNLSHPNVIRLREVVREKEILYLVFQYCDCNLLQVMETFRENSKVFAEDQIRSVVSGLLNAISFLHEREIVHRDIKPENVMFRDGELKLTDFGQARTLKQSTITIINNSNSSSSSSSSFNSAPALTEYVSTRWYRAPEIILRFKNYAFAVDIWSAGCVFAEMYLLIPLFSGSSEMDMLFKICAVVGTPNHWAEARSLCQSLGWTLPTVVKTNLATLLPAASSSAVALIDAMLDFHPGKRITAKDAKKHSFL